MSDQEQALAAFQPQGKYKTPPLPRAGAYELVRARLTTLLGRLEDEPFITDDRLVDEGVGDIVDLNKPPICEPLLNELEACLRPWLDKKTPASYLKVIQLPAANHNNLLTHWAEQYGYRLLTPPARDKLATAKMPKLGASSRAKPVVIPDLAQWFLREQNGLVAVRALLAELANAKQHCVVGCNSWAWAFLSKATQANLVLPTPLCFKPFDAKRLQAWFSELVASSDYPDMRFRLKASGEDIFPKIDSEADENDQEERVHEYFHKLAYRSLGIPWVAWHLWMRSLRINNEQEDESEDEEADVESASDEADKAKPENSDSESIGAMDDENTLWIVDVDDFNLPTEQTNQGLLVLHAVLIHQRLSTAALQQVVPQLNHLNVVTALINQGFLERHEEQLRCVPAAYPAIRDALSASGFCLDKL